MDYLAVLKSTVWTEYERPVSPSREPEKRGAQTLPVFYAKVRDRRMDELIQAGTDPAQAREQSTREIIDFYDKVLKGDRILARGVSPDHKRNVVLTIYPAKIGAQS